RQVLVHRTIASEAGERRDACRRFEGGPPPHLPARLTDPPGDSRPDSVRPGLGAYERRATFNDGSYTLGAIRSRSQGRNLVRRKSSGSAVADTRRPPQFEGGGAAIGRRPPGAYTPFRRNVG